MQPGMMGSQSQQASLTQRTGLALAEALRQDRDGDLLFANG